MKKDVHVGAAALLALAIAAPAAAQLKPEAPIASRILTKPEQIEGARAALIRHQFAQCMYRRRPKTAVALLANSDPIAINLKRANIKNVADDLGMSLCLGEDEPHSAAISISLPLTTVRPLLAEQAYVAYVATRPTLSAGAKEEVERTFVSQGEVLSRAQGLAAFSDCVVFRDLSGADAVVRTVPGSAAEIAAARALAPALGQCLDQGQDLKLNVRSIRMFVADGLWTRFAQPATVRTARSEGTFRMGEVDRVGQCMYRQDSRLAESFLRNSDPFAVKEQVVGKWVDLPNKLNVATCLTEGTRLNVRSVREMLAEGSYLANFFKFPGEAAGAGRRPYASSNPRSLALMQMADCLASRGGAQSDALVRAEPGTAAEAAGMDRLKPMLVQCAGQDAASAMTVTAVRGLAAEGLWVRFVASSTTARKFADKTNAQA